jgi:hypothetical protein
MEDVGICNAINPFLTESMESIIARLTDAENSLDETKLPVNRPHPATVKK